MSSVSLWSNGSMSIGMSASACLSMIVGVLSMTGLFLSLCGSLSMSSGLLSIRKGKSHNYLVGRGLYGYLHFCPSWNLIYREIEK